MNVNDFAILIGNRLNDILLYKNISINKLACISSVSKAQIYRILSGDCYTTLTTLFNLLKSLEVPIENFFNFSMPIEEIFDEMSIYTPSDMLKILSTNLKLQQANLSRLKGLTQAKMADNLNHVDYRYISYLLNGRNNEFINMKVSTLFNISKELELENKIYLLFQTN